MRARLRNTPTWVLGSAHCLVINTTQVQGLCHRGHRAKSITLKRDCLQFDPSVFTGQRRSRISLLLLPLHSLPPSLSPSLSLSLFFSPLLSLMNKEKNNPNQQHTNTHPPSLSVSAERISCPSAVFTGSPGVKTNTGHGLKERGRSVHLNASRPECINLLANRQTSLSALLFYCYVIN